MSSLLWMVLFVAFLAGPALALDPPKVVVTYSMDCNDGGRFVREITDTPLGLGNIVYAMCDLDSEVPSVVVYDSSPLEVVVEYTADPDTQEIVDGPVELVDVDFTDLFDLFALNGVITTVTDIRTDIARTAHGNLVGTVISWDQNPATSYQSSALGTVDCFGNPTICSVGAPPGGWPRVEDGTPITKFLPLWQVSTNVQRADEFVGDNLTPGILTDDLRSSMDAQATVYETWNGVQTGRVYVPEPHHILLLTSGIAGLIAVGRLRTRRLH